MIMIRMVKVILIMRIVKSSSAIYVFLSVNPLFKRWIFSFYFYLHSLPGQFRTVSSLQQIFKWVTRQTPGESDSSLTKTKKTTTKKKKEQLVPDAHLSITYRTINYKHQLLDLQKYQKQTRDKNMMG